MVSRRRKQKREKVSAKRRITEHETGFASTSLKLPEGMQFFKPKEGSVRLEVVPFEVGDGNPFADKGSLYYERTYWVHRGIGPDNNSFVCPQMTCHAKCPICDYRAALMRGAEPDEDVIKDLAPRERQLWNVVNHAELDKGVQLWDVSYHLFGKRLDAEIKNGDEDDGYEFFADPDEGFTLRVTFEEKTFAGNSFLEAVSIHFKERKASLDQELLEAAICLDDILVVKSYEDLKKIFLQADDSGDDEEDDEEERSSKRKRRTRPPVDDEEEDDEDEDEEEEEEDDEDEDEEEEEDDEDEDEEEEEPPKPKRGSRGPAKESGKMPKQSGPKAGSKTSRSDEDDEDDEDDDEEDEEEQPFEVGDFVVHPKYGECEVIRVGKSGVDIEADSGKRYEGIAVSKLKLADFEEEEEEEEDDPPPRRRSKK